MITTLEQIFNLDCSDMELRFTTGKYWLYYCSDKVKGKQYHQMDYNLGELIKAKYKLHNHTDYILSSGKLTEFSRVNKWNKI